MILKLSDFLAKVDAYAAGGGNEFRLHGFAKCLLESDGLKGIKHGRDLMLVTVGLESHKLTNYKGNERLAFSEKVKTRE